jgi:flagellar protein FlaI
MATEDVDASKSGGLVPDEGDGPPPGEDPSALPAGVDDAADAVGAAASAAKTLEAAMDDRVAPSELPPEEVPVTKGIYTWDHFRQEYHSGDPEAFDPDQYLDWPAEATGGVFAAAQSIAGELEAYVDENTVTTVDRFDEEDFQAVDDVDPEDAAGFDEDAFFTDEYGNTTVANRYDLEKAVPEAKKPHFREVDRYWVNEPYSFVVIFHSVKENEKKYYAIQPHRTEVEADLQEFLTGKLRTAIKYSDDDVVVEGTEADRAAVIERETRKLLRRYDVYEGPFPDDEDDDGGLLGMLGLDGLLGDDDGGEEYVPDELDGIAARPESAQLDEDAETLNQYQVEKLLYYLKRNFIGYERIDPIKHDTVNVEDISCDGYNSPVFVYHSDYEQIITNIYHGDDELDDFVVKLAQRSGKGISKRDPQVDVTLPDGSRGQLTLGGEVSDHGTNYTIRQFQEVPFTPVDQIAWNTFSLDEMAFLWLCIENHKSMIIAGGTATGKTTLLNAVSLFIPSSAKIVSIEDTREVELPQRNWIASVTRPSFGEDDKGDVDEFDLLEAALRQRPDYIVMGEVRGEEGRDLFQVMSTGHTSYSTFHADSVGEVLKRFTTDPINVSKTMFTALDLVAIQTRTRVGGHKVVRNKNLTEINHYDAENDEINVQDVYQWQAETDEFLKMGESNTLEGIMFDRGWSHDKLQQELFKREVILAYLIHNGLNTYTEVAATIQAFINDPDTIMTLIANGQLQRSLEDLREMESVMIEVDPEKEEMAPRPEPSDETAQLCLDILDRAEDSLFEKYRDMDAAGVAGVLDEEDAEPDRLELPEETDEEDIEFSGELREGAIDDEEVSMETDEEIPFDAAEERPALDAAEEPPEPDDPSGDEATAEEDGPDWLFDDDESEEVFGDESDATDEDGGASEAAADGEPFAFDGDDDADEDDATAFGETDASEDDTAAFGDGDDEGSDDGGMAFGEDGGDESGTAFGDDGSDDDATAFGDDGSDDDATAFGDDGSDDGGDGGAMAFGDDGAGDEDDGMAFGDGDDDDDEDEEDDAGELAFGDGGETATEGGDD